jgi:hypothetical protein
MFVRAPHIAPMLLFTELTRMVGKKVKVIAHKLIRKGPINDLELIALPELDFARENTR